MLFDRVFLSARAREFKELDEFVCAGGGGGWVARAREDLRGVIVRDGSSSAIWDLVVTVFSYPSRSEKGPYPAGESYDRLA